MRRAVIFVCLLMVTGGFVLTADAGTDYNSGLAAILQVDSTSEYRIGDEVQVWLLVYDEGQPIDPDLINLNVGWQPSRHVPMVKRDTGTYEAKFDIIEADVAAEYDLNIIAWVYRDGMGGPWTTDSVRLPVKHLEFEVSVEEGADEVPSPGETANFTIRSTYDGRLVDPDTGTMEVKRYLSGSTIGIDVPVNRVGTGLYEGSLTLPSTKGSVTFNLAARGEYTSVDGKVHGSGSHSFNVYTLPVWLNTVEVTRTGATVEVHVHELDGIPYPTSIEGYPMEGADVSLQYKYRYDQFQYQEETVTGTTGPDGKASLALAWPDLYKYDLTVQCWGHVMAPNFYRQGFDARIVVRDRVDQVDEDYFEVQLLNHPAPITTPLLDLHFQARDQGTPLANHDVQAYIYDENALYYEDTVTTDGQGNFDISIKPPAHMPEDQAYTSVWMYFSADLGGYWRSDGTGWYVGNTSLTADLDLLVDPQASIQVSSVRENNAVEVVLDHPDADGADERAVVGWGVGDPDLILLNWNLNQEGTWRPLHQYPGWGYEKYWFVNYVPCEWREGAYHASFHYPGFLPDDQEVFCYGVITEIDDAGDSVVAAYAKDLVPQDGKGWPKVSLTGPTPGGTYGGEVNVTGTAADDHGVERVEVRVDNGDWQEAVGTTSWYLVLDTSEWFRGTHYIDLRAFNGEKYSKVLPFAFSTDQMPGLDVASPVDEGRYRGMLRMNGTAWDDGGVFSVNITVDAQAAVTANTELWKDRTYNWSYDLDTDPLASGQHTLAVVAYDGVKESWAARLVFYVDRLPEVDLTDPPDGAEVAGTFHVKGTASDDLSLKAIELRIDGGEWIPVGETTDWSYELDTTALTYGQHTVEARSYDGYGHSPIDLATFTVDNPPTVSEINLLDGQRVGGIFRVTGNASDDGGDVERVEVQVDGGDWDEANGTDEWSYDLDTTDLEKGDHTLRVRSYAGGTYSPEQEFTFVVDEKPEVGEVSIEAGDKVGGTVTVTGNASDDERVDKVQVRVDGGEWVDVDGGENWRYDLDTTGLDHGYHTLEVRVWDGYQWSEPWSVEFFVDQPPEVVIGAPDAGAKLKKAFEAIGTASDDGSVMSVEVRIDGGEWQLATGTTAWTLDVKLKGLKKGEHTLEARAYDGEQYSDTASVGFQVAKEDKDDGPGPGAALAALALLGSALAARRRRR